MTYYKLTLHFVSPVHTDLLQDRKELNLKIFALHKGGFDSGIIGNTSNT